MKNQECIICKTVFQLRNTANFFGETMTDKRTVCDNQECLDINTENEIEARKRFHYNRVRRTFPASNKKATLSDYDGYLLKPMVGGSIDAKQMARFFSQSDESWFIGMLGTTGTGKTRFGLVLLAQLAYHGRFNGCDTDPADTSHTVGYFKARELNSIIKGDIVHPSGIGVTRLKGMRILMIDELKPRKEMEYRDSSALEDLLEVRHDAGLKTILTSNMQPSAFEAEYPAIFSRCAQGLFELNGTDRRR